MNSEPTTIAAPVDAIVLRLSSFQRALWEDLDCCRWYTVYDIDDFERLPDWFFRTQTQPFATIRPMVEKGALVMNQHPIGMGMTVPILKKPCCDRMDEYNGFRGPVRLFDCPNGCWCHD